MINRSTSPRARTSGSRPASPICGAAGEPGTDETFPSIRLPPTEPASRPPAALRGRAPLLLLGPSMYRTTLSPALRISQDRQRLVPGFSERPKRGRTPEQSRHAPVRASDSDARRTCRYSLLFGLPMLFRPYRRPSGCWALASGIAGCTRRRPYGQNGRNVTTGNNRRFSSWSERA